MVGGGKMVHSNGRRRKRAEKGLREVLYSSERLKMAAKENRDKFYRTQEESPLW